MKNLGVKRWPILTFELKKTGTFEIQAKSMSPGAPIILHQSGSDHCLALIILTILATQKGDQKPTINLVISIFIRNLHFNERKR